MLMAWLFLGQVLTALLIQETPALSGEGVEGCLQRMEQYAKKLRLEELKRAGEYNEEYWRLLKELKQPLQSRNSELSHESNS